MIHLQTPLTTDKLVNLKSGDQVLLSGTIYTGRDAAHARLVKLIENNEDLPFDIKDATIFYVGPTPTKPGEVFGSGGPTTSYRMDSFAPLLISLGLKTMIGKGDRNQEVKDAIVKYQGVYFGAIGGTGALIGNCVLDSQVIAFEDLGPEAIRRLEVKDMPLVVINDTFGNDQYQSGKKQYLEFKEKNKC